MTESIVKTAGDPKPGANLVPGLERYFELVRHQLDLHREFAMTWATALTSMSAAVLGQLHTVEHIWAEQADQLAEHAHGAERVAKGMAEQVEIAEKTLGSWTEHQRTTPATVHRLIPTQRSVFRHPAPATKPATAAPDEVRVTPDIFDELIELIVDEDIKAAMQ